MISDAEYDRKIREVERQIKIHERNIAWYKSGQVIVLSVAISFSVFVVVAILGMLGVFGL